MIYLITGASHTGKTLFAQKLLEKIHFPYLSIDHLKMGLIRSGKCNLTPYDDNELTPYLWSIVCEIIKTAVENNQNLIIEGCYIPFDWEKDFSQRYLDNIRYICLVMSEDYIKNHFDDIKRNADIIETRLDDSDFSIESSIKDNEDYLIGCKQNGCSFYLMSDRFSLVELLNEFQ